jgi:hypothetical protein
MLKSTRVGCLYFFVGIDVNKVRDCMGDPNVDRDNAILKGEQEAQVTHGLYI